ncbi:hypothetical protein [Hoyosella subflava]|uniref:Uncharacterized protein n=1 Tax=Hoyosella subflava (strain DSM 45089 / JCM 17490 / NBRC 109087 / DQS3-9A1) TaxID=443218 RepID=F6ES42_HOYSD|nr:hypothetical protein [Hoyosella subflava]AEF42046.1 hypothetical protein AS9A_3608 [Hoyosella subflava DQS3-9A1]
MVGKLERGKDVTQQLVESAATHVGRITVIITGAVAGVAREIGDWVTDGFEMVEAAKRAEQDKPRELRQREDYAEYEDEDADYDADDAER